ncbi:hypothetical protein ACJJIF_15705 [Microbulbifer sp. SSSA002]
MSTFGLFERKTNDPVLHVTSEFLPNSLEPDSTNISNGLITGTLAMHCSLFDEYTENGKFSLLLEIDLASWIKLHMITLTSLYSAPINGLLSLLKKKAP